MKVIFRILLVLLIASFESNAQGWRVYYPPDKSFSVKLPVPLQRVTSFEGEHGTSTSAPVETHKAVLSYVAFQTKPKVREYGVIVIDGKSKESSPAERKKRIKGFEFFIGGDDVTPTSERSVHVTGLTGKEYVYAKEIADGIYTRGRVFDAGERIYVIVFRARTAEDLNSLAADKFLNSFRPH